MVVKRRYIRSAALPIVAISSLTILNGCKESDPRQKIWMTCLWAIGKLSNWMENLSQGLTNM
jgi:hypothetical protein